MPYGMLLPILYDEYFILLCIIFYFQNISNIVRCIGDSMSALSNNTNAHATHFILVEPELSGGSIPNTQ